LEIAVPKYRFTGEDQATFRLFAMRFTNFPLVFIGVFCSFYAVNATLSQYQIRLADDPNIHGRHAGLNYVHSHKSGVELDSTHHKKYGISAEQAGKILGSNIARMHRGQYLRHAGSEGLDTILVESLMTDTQEGQVLFHNLAAMLHGLSELNKKKDGNGLIKMSADLHDMVDLVEIGSMHLSTHNILSSWILRHFGHDHLNNVIDACGRWRRQPYLPYEFGDSHESLKLKLETLFPESHELVGKAEFSTRMFIAHLIFAHDQMTTSLSFDGFAFFQLYCLVAAVVKYLEPEIEAGTYLKKLFVILSDSDPRPFKIEKLLENEPTRVVAE
jgi:hypothetical protein